MKRCYCRQRWCNLIFCLLLVDHHLSRRHGCVAVLVANTDNVQQQQQQDECFPDTDGTEQQQYQRQQQSEKKKEEYTPLVGNDDSKSQEGLACSFIACHQTTPSLAVDRRQTHKRPCHHHLPLPSLLEQMKSTWEHFRVHILHLPPSSRQQTKQRYNNKPQQLHDHYYSSEEAVMAAQLQLSQSSSSSSSSSDDGVDINDIAQGQQRGPRRMARIVRVDNYNDDECAYPRGNDDDDDDNDNDNDDSDSNDVFALENTKNKCLVNSNNEDYYVPVVTAEMEPHIGMILEVSNLPFDASDNDEGDGGGGDKKDMKRDSTKNNNKVRYQLTQPMDLELGTTVKHAADYAYIPVLSARVEPILVVTPQNQNEQQQERREVLAGNDGDDDDAKDGQKRRISSKSTTKTKTTDKSLVGAEDNRSPNEWWQWWIPWSTWRQQRKDDESGGHHYHHQERYRMKENKAFAGGSHGQVWRGTRRCDDHDETATTTIPTKKRSKTNGRRAAAASDTAHQYKLPLDDLPQQQQEREQAGAAADSDNDDDWCNESLVLKKLKVEQSYRILEAGLREVYFGHLLRSSSQSGDQMFTRYVDHFFLERSNNSSAPQLELWIVYRHAGPSLRSFLYTGSLVGDYMIFQNSRLWTQLRKSMSESSSSSSSSSSQHQNHQHEKHHVQTERHVNGSACEDCDVSVVLRHPSSHLPRQNSQEETETVEPGVDAESRDEKKRHQTADSHPELPHSFARDLMRSVLKQILQAAAFLHDNGIVHRDIKPSNIMCETKLNATNLHLWAAHDNDKDLVNCVLGDFSSAWNEFADANLYTGGPSRAEQTDEYAPPEAIFGRSDLSSKSALVTPAFDSWSIGIVALELLMGTPNVFSVDQRTKAVLTHKLEKRGASEKYIDRALYLAALSQFCIYNPLREPNQDWPYRDGDPLQLSSMVKESCTMKDFRFALQARDPLGIGFDSSSDTLLHLIWQLLAWSPSRRISPAAALKHPYFTSGESLDTVAGEHNALESQMLDPRMDFNASDVIAEFRCPKCGRVFGDWMSCHSHAVSRKHANFCDYDRSNLPTCLNAHSMLPAHSFSGYCDIQGKRKVIEDFHAIHLLPSQQFYGIFDGHTGNLASKYVASFLYSSILRRIENIDIIASKNPNWKSLITEEVSQAFVEIHQRFLDAISLVPHIRMDQSGTTATIAVVSPETAVIASLGDSRAVLSSLKDGKYNAVRLTKDHIASDPIERANVEAGGGHVMTVNGVERVNGTLVVTRSIGDANLASILSQTPDVIAMSKLEVKGLCGDLPKGTEVPCFIILASDGLWDKVSDIEAVHMVAETLSKVSNSSHWKDSSGLQQSAEALVQEAYVRGSTDNIGVCVVAIQ